MVLKVIALKQGPKKLLPPAILKKILSRNLFQTLNSYFRSMIKYQIPHTQLKQIDDHKHDLY